MGVHYFFVFSHAHSPDRIEQNSITLSASLLSPAVNTASEVGYSFNINKENFEYRSQKPSGIQETTDLNGSNSRTKGNHLIFIEITFDIIYSNEVHGLEDDLLFRVINQ